MTDNRRSSSLIGSTLNGIYEVTRFIARGGMGEVYEGKNVNSDEKVAIKVILPEHSSNPQVQAMFLKEARILTKLSHPALVQYRVFAQEPEIGCLYIAMDFIDGTNLSNVLSAYGPTLPEITALTRRLADGLRVAHDLGAIHRDLSPDNVLLERGRLERARIIDFSIATDTSGGSATIVGDGFAGKLGYVAPEQLGDFDCEIGPWTDVYSLGLVILSFARGAPSNIGTSLVDAVEMRRKPADLSDIPAGLRPLLQAMLVPNPRIRLRSMAEVIDVIDRSNYQRTMFAPPGTMLEASIPTSPPPSLPQPSPVLPPAYAPASNGPSAPSWNFSRRRASKSSKAPKKRIPKGGEIGSIYTVWFGTNRQADTNPRSSDFFSSLRCETVTYGQCDVFIPVSHRIGSTGSGWFRRLVTRVDDRIVLRTVNSIDQAQFWSSAKETLERLERIERDAVVFIHGYNVSFEQAAIRTAQIGHDLSITGIMAFFSWPSQGELGGYLKDGESIQASEIALESFLLDVLNRSGAERVSVIAHSMGNRGLLRVFDRISRQKNANIRKFNQIILASPDVDVTIFKQLSESYTKLSFKTTLYLSSKDRAVSISRWLHQFDRVGLSPPITVVPSIDTINVANIDLSILGHGFVAEAREVLQDMHRLITKGDAPQCRFGLRPHTTEQGDCYWEIGC